MRIKNRQQFLILLALAGAALLVCDALVITPLARAWKSRSERVAELQRRVNDGEGLLRREESIDGRWTQMRTNALPDDPSLAEQKVLKAFDRWSQTSRISVNSITPQWKRENEEYRTLVCRVDAAGTVGTLARFLYDVEKDGMALKVESLELTARDKEGRELSMGLQVSGLALDTTEESR
jgi:hypothetical protein